VGSGCSGRQAERPGDEVVTDQELEALEAIGYVSHTLERADPSRSGVTTIREDRIQAGNTFTTLVSQCRAKLLDSTGRELHRWGIPDCKRWSHAELLPDGGLVVSAVLEEEGRRRGRRVLVRLNARSEEVWRRELAAHHDQIVEPDGRTLVLVNWARPAPPDLQGDTVLDNLVAEIDGQGKAIKMLSLLDTLDRDEFGLTELARSGGGGRLDLYHANSLAWMPTLPDRHPVFRKNNLLLSLRHQDRIIVVDWVHGELLWQWGRGILSGPHDASPLPNGHILVFDNGVRDKQSRVLEIDPTTGGVVWQYPDADPAARFYTEARGSAQRLANGNTLLCDSNNGRIVEVTPGGETVWEYWEPTVNEDGFRAVLVRAYRYPATYGSFADGERQSAAPTSRRPHH